MLLGIESIKKLETVVDFPGGGKAFRGDLNARCWQRQKVCFGLQSFHWTRWSFVRKHRPKMKFLIDFESKTHCTNTKTTP